MANINLVFNKNLLGGAGKIEFKTDGKIYVENPRDGKKEDTGIELKSKERGASTYLGDAALQGGAVNAHNSLLEQPQKNDLNILNTGNVQFWDDTTGWTDFVLPFNMKGGPGKPGTLLVGGVSIDDRNTVLGNFIRSDQRINVKDGIITIQTYDGTNWNTINPINVNGPRGTNIYINHAPAAAAAATKAQ